MYRINYTGDNVLLTYDEVLKKIAADQAVDERIVIANIELAEKRFIVPVIGDAMYDDFCNQKNVTVTNVNQADLIAKINGQPNPPKKPVTTTTLPIGAVVNAIEFVNNTNYVTLWNKGLWKWAAEAVDASCIIPNWARQTGQGVMNNSPKSILENGKDASSVDRKGVELKLADAIENRVNPMQSRVVAYVCANVANYTLFKKCNCRCDEDGVNADMKGGMIFPDVYAELDNIIDAHTIMTKDHWQWWDKGGPLNMRVEPIIGDGNCNNNNIPVVPSTGKTVRMLEFDVVDEQTQFPYVGQTNENVLLDAINGADFSQLFMNGVLLPTGTDEGNVIGFSGNPQRLNWVTPATVPTKCQLFYIK